MEGYLLLADGMRLDGVLNGAPETAIGWLVANTAVVGFQEMITDPAYRGAIVAFTYPEVGSVGVAEQFSESAGVQAAGVLVKVLSEFRSHYQAEEDLEQMLAGAGVPCLCGVDTRGVAVHLREEGEMAAAIAPAEVDEAELLDRLQGAGRPDYSPPQPGPGSGGDGGPKVAVLNLGIRRSELAQLARGCRPEVLPADATADDVLAAEPDGLFVSDGPGMTAPPQKAVQTVSELVGRLPVLAAGLGHVALGAALGCRLAFLKRGHHGVNCPVRNVQTGEVAVTSQRHSSVLDRGSVEDSPDVELTHEHINDRTVEGIATADETAVGLQFMPVPSEPGTVSAPIADFLANLGAE